MNSSLFLKQALLSYFQALAMVIPLQEILFSSVSLYFLSGLTPICLSKFKSANISSGKTFADCSILRSIHYTLSSHGTYYSICFLECSDENNKDLHTWHRILTTKTPQHSTGLRHLGITENTRKLLNTCMGMGLCKNCILCAQYKTLDFTSGASSFT